jgi:L-alanine-DL-glutamate epimerase-like enolase superfamily enzyme
MPTFERRAGRIELGRRRGSLDREGRGGGGGYSALQVNVGPHGERDDLRTVERVRAATGNAFP